MHKPTESRSSANPRENKLKEIHARTYHNQAAENKTQREFSKQPKKKKKKCVPYRGEAIQLAVDFSFQTMEAKTERHRTFSHGERKELST